MMSEVQEKEQKHPVTLKALSTHKPTHIPVDTSRHMAKPSISREGKRTLLLSGGTAKSYAKAMDTGRAGFRDMSPVQMHLGPTLRRVPPLAESSAVSFVRFLITFCHGAPHFHFLLGPANYIASPGYGGG